MEKKKLIIIIVASVLALALVITGSVFLVKSFFKGGSEVDNNSDIPTTSSENDPGYVIAGSVNITAGSAEGKTGDTVEIPINCTENPGINYSMGGIKYDATKLKFVSFEKGDVFKDVNYKNNDGVVTMDLSSDVLTEDITGNGLLCTVKFEIIAEEDGETPVEVVFNDGFTCNSNEEIVSVNAQNGKVTIKN